LFVLLLDLFHSYG